MPLCRKRSRRNRDAPKLPSIRDKCPRCEYGPTGSCCIFYCTAIREFGSDPLPLPDSGSKFLIFFGLEIVCQGKVFSAKELPAESSGSISYVPYPGYSGLDIEWKRTRIARFVRLNAAN
jgi:hypothetical protein